jgi:hypothetical protein
LESRPPGRYADYLLIFVAGLGYAEAIGQEKFI